MRLPISLAFFVVMVFGCGGAPVADAPAPDASVPIAPPTIDGYTYKTVKIGDQEWFAENLKTTVYANGDEIPYSRTDESWTTQEMGMRCPYAHDEEGSALYGQLYNWYAVDDARGLCPNGWHVPSDYEWENLEVYLGFSRADVSIQGDRGSGELGIGTKLKASNGWEDAGNGADDFGFSALPGGYRYFNNGSFDNAGYFGYWWSSSPNLEGAWYRSLTTSSPVIGRYSSDIRFGFSVRCLRDAE